jgi:hypothetical protein
LIDLVSVAVLVPPGVLIVVCDFSLLSSEQPGIPLPKPASKTLMIVALISFLICVTFEFGNSAARELA